MAYRRRRPSRNLLTFTSQSSHSPREISGSESAREDPAWEDASPKKPMKSLFCLTVPAPVTAEAGPVKGLA